MRKRNTSYQAENVLFAFVNLLEEVSATICIATNEVVSPLVLDSLKTVQCQLDFIKDSVKRQQEQDFSELIAVMQTIRQQLLHSSVQVHLRQECEVGFASSYLCLSRSIVGHLLTLVRDCEHHLPQRKGLLIYLENLYVALSELADVENNCRLQDEIVNQVVARCKDILQTQETRHTNLYEEAWDIISKARQETEKVGVPVVITLVDQSAEVIMTYRMEDALLVSSDMAYKKAYTAVGMKMQSKDLVPLTQPGQWLFNLETMTDNKVVSLAEGIPIYDGKRIIDAVGVSGGSSEQDQQIVEAALR